MNIKSHLYSVFTSPSTILPSLPPPFLHAVADIPGLVPGAHLNKGLGHSFLRHIQRCSILLLVLDGSNSAQANMDTQLQHLQQELKLYDKELLNNTHLIVINKMDIRCRDQSGCGLNDNDIGRAFEVDVHRLHEDTGLPVVPISALQLWNIHPLKEALFRIINSITVK